MQCPYCDHELEYTDYFGKYLGNDQWNKRGEIFKCCNENCESFDTHFHYYLGREWDLIEGYPC